MEPTFEKFLVHRQKDEVNFIVVGGLAVTLKGDSVQVMEKTNRTCLL